MADVIHPTNSDRRKSLTVERLRDLVHYDLDTGIFTWRFGRAGASQGAVIGRINRLRRGYRYVCVDRGVYSAHRLAWFYVHGRWPKADVDHINGICDDNRIANLREATRSQNLFNARKHVDGAAPYKGICWDRSRDKWIAVIRVDGRQKNLGRFYSAEEARDAYVAAAQRIAGEFARF